MGSAAYVGQNGMIAGIVGGGVALILGVIIFIYLRRRKSRQIKYLAFEVAASQLTVQEQIGTYSFGPVLLVRASNLRENLGLTINVCAKQLPNVDTKKGKEERRYALKEANTMMTYSAPHHNHVSCAVIILC